MSRLDIGRRVDEHVRPDTPALQGFAFARCCGFSSASIPHALTGKVGSGSRRFRPHAVAYDLWLPPAGSIRDLHPPPFIHARRTRSPYGLPCAAPDSVFLPLDIVILLFGILSNHCPKKSWGGGIVHVGEAVPAKVERDHSIVPVGVAGQKCHQVIGF